VTYQDIQATEEHNAAIAAFPPGQADAMLNTNIVNWLGNDTLENSDGDVLNNGVLKKFEDCLDAPNYTVFSNGTSAVAWNKAHFAANREATTAGAVSTNANPVVPLESPHNNMHLAIGGVDVPQEGNEDAYADANGDMGENDTAAYDPIFFFHHCFIDKRFWEWQQKWNSTTQLEIIPDYPGTENPTAEQPQLMMSPLVPFLTGGKTTIPLVKSHFQRKECKQD
jgi:tyrosinase